MFVNVIKRKALEDFWTKPRNRVAEGPMRDWFRLARKARWRHFEDTKATFSQTDVATDTASGRTATIFDIGGNKYRIVALVDYPRQVVFITHVMDHKTYDKNRWKQDI